MSIKFDLQELFNNLDIIDYEALYKHFKENYRQLLYVKRIEEDLLLIHNNLDKMSKNNLFHECRSIVINTEDKKVPHIISYTHDNVLYTSVNKYKPIDNDIIEESFEGTMVNVFYHNNKWYFTSTRCPSIDESYYFNKEKSHGVMLDEILGEMFIDISKDSESLRNEFVKYLDKNKTYNFVIIHHENKYIVDYTKQFGSEYKKLCHIITRDKDNHLEVDIKIDLPLVYPKYFSNIDDAKEWLNKDDNNINPTYEGLIIKRKDINTSKNLLIKIHSDLYTKIRFEKPNHINPMINCIEIFQRNDKTYSPDTYINKYHPELSFSDKKLDITGILFYIMKNIAYELLIVYNYFTNFDPNMCKYYKKNEIVYKKLFEDPKMKTLQNHIFRLQNYQIKFLKNHLYHNNIIEHLRHYTSPEEIYNLMLTHLHIIENDNELSKLIKNQISNFEKVNQYIKMYCDKY